MLFNTIMNTLTIEAKRKVILFERDYIYEGCMIGTSLLKIVIRESHIDSNAQILAIKGLHRQNTSRKKRRKR
jgi:hypothetical protein